MLRHIRFCEEVTYEVEVDIPDDEDPEFEDGDGRWFELLDEQREHWVTESCVGVSERAVLDVDGEPVEDYE